MARWYGLDRHGVVRAETEAPDSVIATAKLQNALGPLLVTVQSQASYEERIRDLEAAAAKRRER